MSIDNIKQSYYQDQNQIQTRTRKAPPYRWVLLLIYCMFMSLSGFSTLVMYSIGDITSNFFDIRIYQLTWSANALWVIQMALLFFSGFYSARYGLRHTMIVGSGILATSLSLFVSSIQRQGFPFFVASIATGSVGYILVQPLSALLASSWFDQHEQAMAINMGVSVTPCLGMSLAFLMPITVFGDATSNEDMNSVQTKLLAIAGVQAGISILTFILSMALYQDTPAMPYDRINNNDDSDIDDRHSIVEELSVEDFLRSIKLMMSSVNYLAAANAAALPLAAMQTLGTILNPLLSWRYEKRENIIGWFGCSTLWTSAIGSFIISKLADRKKQYKSSVLVSQVLALIAWVSFSLMLIKEWGGFELLILALSLSTFFSSPCCGIVMEMVLQITHPIPPSTAVAPIIFLSNLYSTCFMFLTGWLLENGDHSTNLWLVAGMLAISEILTFFIKSDQKLQNIGSNSGNGTVVIENIIS